MPERTVATYSSYIGKIYYLRDSFDSGPRLIYGIKQGQALGVYFRVWVMKSNKYMLQNAYVISSADDIIWPTINNMDRYG